MDFEYRSADEERLERKGGETVKRETETETETERQSGEKFRERNSEREIQRERLR